jgi:hypothetical protein
MKSENVKTFIKALPLPTFCYNNICPLNFGAFLCFVCGMQMSPNVNFKLMAWASKASSLIDVPFRFYYIV